jgi:nitrate/nitrite transporter NarK
MTAEARPYHWAILAVCVLAFFVGGLVVPVVLGYALDLTGSFRAAFTACAAFEVVALAVACFTRESGGRAATVSGSGGSC